MILSDPLFIAKILWTVLLLFLTIAFCVAPFFILKRIKMGPNTKIIMGYMNSLAAGVVLGALLMHMIPELNHSHGGHVHQHNHGHHNEHAHHHEHGHHGHKHKKNGHGPKKGEENQCEYPWGPLAAGISFLVLFAIDRLAMDHSHPHHGHGEESQAGHKNHNHKHPKHHHHHHDHEHAHHHDHHHDHKHEKGEENKACDHAKNECIGENIPHVTPPSSPAPSSTSLLGSAPSFAPSLNSDCHDCSTDHCCIDIGCDRKELEVEDDDKSNCHSHDVMGGCHMDSFTSTSTQSQTIVFILAMSLHSFLEGLGLGTKKDQTALMSFLGSLFAHKWLEAFALGVAILRANYSSGRTFLLIFIYSILTPLGMIGSVVLKSSITSFSSSKSELVSLILDGLAAGSFLFVSCIEMIPPEFHQKDKHTKWKFLALSVGFAFMAAIQIYHTH
jgi:zinc transporter ZupT